MSLSVAEQRSLYLQDLITLLKEKAFDAKARHDAKRADDRAYEAGRLMALYETISLMQQQAMAFGIPLEDLRLHDVHPDRDLL